MRRPFAGCATARRHGGPRLRGCCGPNRLRLCEGPARRRRDRRARGVTLRPFPGQAVLRGWDLCEGVRGLKSVVFLGFYY